ncbi:unnamed protein product [Arabidopsis lyrata]|uniref:Pollen ole e 1 allergen and extensin family protein n=1 Tax=Arabidopsis lyrata subsp. lyrata TaxID=81972 RepID=D7LEF7_ARALL|nr:uncharacterized protein LOC9315912 [Arabidopsis lyrata subsp. lyrata]EFH56104.1 hypothetical protein ARALYDRAFT_483053 [Arabidopsis lyrata subsp. lyrata]CAH8265390.1 unnamed protein product [Arabidopsis lyrata]|eukprot:XP_020883885.1 uncharacterized protein LOC9315912 [Arabidopsis lyrata subsp. lyrata]
MESFFILRCFLLLSFFFFNGAFTASSKLWSIREMSDMAGYGEHKLSSVVITGSLLCNTPISGATVAIKCHTGFQKRSKWIKGVTNDFGEFVIHLPSHLHAIPQLEKACFIKPIHVPKHYHRCYHTFSKSNIHKGIKLVSSRNGFRVYTSGTIKLHGGHSSRTSQQPHKANM